MRYIIPFWLLFPFFLSSCKDDIDEIIKGNELITPDAPVLIQPGNFENCEIGIDLGVEAQVNFQWEPAKYALEYTLEISGDNSFTNTISTNSTGLNISLPKSATYSWKVIAKNQELIKESDVWKFYIPSSPEEFIAPFPAQLIFPENNSSVEIIETQLEFSWETQNLEDNSISFTLILDEIKESDTVSTQFSGILGKSYLVEVNKNSQYQWSIITSDGNAQVKSSTNSFSTY
ncbi:MAG: hypothetical protein RLZZ241_1742 [Bacteroidota bacterium]|jgi:hypothetical protein